VYRWLDTFGTPYVRGTITTLELLAPTPDEPENLEFFMEWDVPLECEEAQTLEQEEAVPSFACFFDTQRE